MTRLPRSLVWIDHHQARVVRPLAKGFDARTVAGDEDRPHERKHDGGHRHPISVRFTDRVAAAVHDDRDLVVAGPSTAKEELLAQLRARHREVAERVSLLVTLDDASDARLAARARELFERLDRMRGIHLPQAPR